MSDKTLRQAARSRIRRALLSALLIGAAAPGFGQGPSVFAGNEVRAAGMKDRLRDIKTSLKDGSEGARRLTAAITDAFKGADDWAPAVEDYYARKSGLAARAEALESKLDAALGLNSSDRSEESAKALDAVGGAADVLRADYEFYMKLPRLAEGPQRHAAQAAMRLLAATGDYPVALAFFIERTPRRPPFAPMAPGVTAIRPR
jgi:hypothetical protein